MIPATTQILSTSTSSTLSKYFLPVSFIISFHHEEEVYQSVTTGGAQQRKASLGDYCDDEMCEEEIKNMEEEKGTRFSVNQKLIKK